MPAGRKPKPTKLKVLEGHRAHRPLPQNEPEPAPGVPPMPTGLSAWGRSLWKTVTEELDRLGLLTIADGAAMQAAIKAADTANAADRTLNKLLKRCASGKAADKDWYHLSMANNVSKKGWNQFKAFATEFGMTPASRSRLSTDSAPAKSSARAVDSIERVVCG